MDFWIYSVEVIGDLIKTISLAWQQSLLQMGFKGIVGGGIVFRHFFQGISEVKGEEKNVAVVQMEVKI